MRLDSRPLDPVGRSCPSTATLTYGLYELIAALWAVWGNGLPSRENREGVLWAESVANRPLLHHVEQGRRGLLAVNLVIGDYPISPPPCSTGNCSSRTSTASPTGQRYVNHDAQRLAGDPLRFAKIGATNVDVSCAISLLGPGPSRESSVNQIARCKSSGNLSARCQLRYTVSRRSPRADVLLAERRGADRDMT